MTDLVITVALCYFLKRLSTGLSNSTSTYAVSTGTLTGYLALYTSLLFWTKYCTRAVVQVCALILVSPTSLQGQHSGLICAISIVQTHVHSYLWPSTFVLESVCLI